MCAKIAFHRKPMGGHCSRAGALCFLFLMGCRTPIPCLPDAYVKSTNPEAVKGQPGQLGTRMLPVGEERVYHGYSGFNEQVLVIGPDDSAKLTTTVKFDDTLTGTVVMIGHYDRSSRVLTLHSTTVPSHVGQAIVEVGDEEATFSDVPRYVWKDRGPFSLTRRR